MSQATTSTATAADFYSLVCDAILAVAELYPSDSDEYKEFFNKAIRDRDFYYPIVLRGTLTTQQALRQIQDNFESYLPELAWAQPKFIFALQPFTTSWNEYLSRNDHFIF